MTTALLGVAWIFMSREPVSQQTGITLIEAPIVGHLAPDFTLANTTGQAFALSDYVSQSSRPGRPVVLNFWATWCAPCRLEMPSLQNISVKYNGRIAILGINQAESAPMITDFAAGMGLTYPLLVDQDNQVNQLYDVVSLPTTLFIDGRGIVREVVIGIMSQAVIEDRVERLLAEGSQQARAADNKQ
jgi:thiol-disulfide isomerase/thioredoxin